MFDDEASFVKYMLADQPPRPANMAHIVAVNQGREPNTMDLAPVPVVDAEGVERAMTSGCRVLDARPFAAYGLGHIEGAINVSLGSSAFEQSVGWILPGDDPVLLVVDQPKDAALAALKLAFVGLDRRIAGAVTHGAWVAAGRDLATLPQMDIDTLRNRLSNGDGLGVLDVREAGEWSAGHIERATLINYKHLPSSMEDLPFDRKQPVAVVCAGGLRSSTAASILRHHGYRDVHNVAGGMMAWNKAGLPTV